MNSDELGEKGQQQFGVWCADAGLTCNPSTRDRAGWDFVVDFPHQPSVLSLDHRPGPLSCIVQLKTVQKTTPSVRLRLDMAERLAKEAKPAFIISPVVDGLDVVDVRVWHIRGEHMAVILMRLRKEQQKGSAAEAGKKHISFALSGGQSIGVTGLALRHLFETSCPEGMLAYTAAKRKECATLGFGERPLEVKFSVDETDPLKLLDFFLGKVTNKPGTMTNAVETRFGVSLPLPLAIAGKGTLTVEPAMTGRALIRVEADALAAPLVDHAEVFSVPFEIAGHSRLTIRGRHLAVVVTRFPDGQATVTIDPLRAAEEFLLADWVQRAMAQQVPLVDGAELELELENSDIAPVRMSLPPPSAKPAAARNAAVLAMAARTVAFIVERTGDDSRRVWQGREMDKACRTAIPLALLRDGATVGFRAAEAVDEFEEARILVVGTVAIGEKMLAWHGHCRVSATALTPTLCMTLDCFQFSGAKRLAVGETLVSYATAVHRRVGGDGIFWVGWENTLVGGSFSIGDAPSLPGRGGGAG